MATTPLFTPALESFDDLVSHDGLLTPDELEQIALDIVARPDVWEPLVQERISIARAREHLVDRLAAPWNPPPRG